MRAAGWSAVMVTGFALAGMGLVGLHAQTPAAPQVGSQAGSPHGAAAAGPDGKPNLASNLGPNLAEEQFKNIQVLKGVPADQVIPAMQFIAASLGVECEYCHVQRALDRDDKKTKQTARKMIAMVMAINKENFDSHRAVTCNTCHRGAPDPVAVPAVASSDEPVEPHAAEHAEGDRDEHKARVPDAAELLRDYLNAVGGRDALHTITSRVEKGKLVAGMPGMKEPVPIELYAKAPDKRISVMHSKAGDSVTAFNGQQGWLAIGGRTHMMSGPEMDSARMDADLYFPANVPSLYARFVTLAGEKIDGHETWLVVGQNAPGEKSAKPPLRLYLDKDTGLLLRLVRYVETPIGRNPTQIDFADYRAADGVKIPYRWTLARPGGRFTIQIDTVEQNVPVDDAKFLAPRAEPVSGPAR